MAVTIDGKAIALSFQDGIKNYVNARVAKGFDLPTLAVVQIGNDGGATFYRQSVVKLCEKLTVPVIEYVRAEETDEAEVLEIVNEINNRNDIHGALILMPMPKGIDSKKIIDLLSPRKDIDGLTDVNSGRLLNGKKSFVPCTPRSVVEILKTLSVEIEGKEVVIIGRSNVVGKPLAQLLLNLNATVTIAHSKTKNLKEVSKRADILISAIGKPLFIDNSYVKEGAIIIDVGTSNVNGKITGDVDFEDVKNSASFITKVPGGVGSVTTTILIENLCEACEIDVY